MEPTVEKLKERFIGKVCNGNTCHRLMNSDLKIVRVATVRTPVHTEYFGFCSEDCALVAVRG